MKQIASPFQFFADRSGDPLDAGYIYIGAVNQNPETTPIAVYWDEAGTQPAAQPLRTSAGYIVNGSTRSRVYVSADDYSMTIKDKAGQLVGSLPNVESAATIRSELASGASSSNGSGMIGHGGNLNYVAGTIGAVLNDVCLNVKMFPWLATGDGSTDDRDAIQAAFATVKANGGTLIFPAGQYRIRSSIGTDQLNSADLANNVKLHFEPGAHVFYDPSSAPAFGAGAIVLEGDNVAITGSLLLTSSKDVDWLSAPVPQRTPYYAGIVIGGKGNRRISRALGQEKSGVLVEGATVRDFNAPITVFAASRVVIRNNVVEDFTDTGILIDDALNDIAVYGNTVRRGSDDCIFARHYRTTPWVANGYYIGNVRIYDNTLTDTFAKAVGFGGYSDVQVYSNYCKNTWYAAISAEVEAPSWADNTVRFKIHSNVIIDAARNFDPTNLSLPAAQQAPVSDTTQQAGILFTTSSASWPADIFVGCEVFDNTIVNPGWHAISGRSAIDVMIRGNRMVPGRTTKGGTNYDTGGAAVRLEDVQEVAIQSNRIVGNGSQSWVRCYDWAGTVLTQKIRVDSNLESFTSALFGGASAIYQALKYIGGSLAADRAWTPPSVGNGSCLRVQTTLTEAIVGDTVSATYTQDLQGLSLTAYVPTNGVIEFVVGNMTGATVALANGTLRARVHRR